MELDPFSQHRAFHSKALFTVATCLLPLSFFFFFLEVAATCVTPPMHRPPAVLVELGMSVQRAGEDGLHLLPAFILQGARERGPDR